MAKYDEQFKLEVAQEYLSGSVGHRRVAQVRGVPRTRLLTWVHLYRAHGVAGLKRKFSHYSPEFKLTVIERMRTDALSFGQVAALFNVRTASCIGQWECCYDAGGLEALASRKRGSSRHCGARVREGIGDKQYISTIAICRVRAYLMHEVTRPSKFADRHPCGSVMLLSSASWRQMSRVIR